MRPIAIVPGLIAALAISCLYVSRLNACDISQNPYCTIDDIGPVESSASDQTKSDARANVDTASIAKSRPKHRRHAKSASRRTRDAMARINEDGKADDDGKAQETKPVAMDNDGKGSASETRAASGVHLATIPAAAIAGAISSSTLENTALFSVQTAEAAIPILRAIIPVVDAHALNEIDRMADGGTSGNALNADALRTAGLNATTLNAMASMDMADAAPPAWRNWLPFGETSVIGQIFIAIGSLLTLATAARMFVA